MPSTRLRPSSMPKHSTIFVFCSPAVLLPAAAVSAPDEKRADIHEAFLALSCILWRSLGATDAGQHSSPPTRKRKKFCGVLEIAKGRLQSPPPPEPRLPPPAGKSVSLIVS